MRRAATFTPVPRQPVIPTSARCWPTIPAQEALATIMAAVQHYPKAVENFASLAARLGLAAIFLADD
jgi:hypothetical protein